MEHSHAVASALATPIALLAGGAAIAQSTSRSSAPTPPLSTTLHPVDRPAGTPIAPRLSAHTVSDRPCFVWTPLPAGANATLEVSRTPDFAQVALRMSVRGDRLDAPTALATGVWYWRVRTATDGGAPVRIARFVVRANGGRADVSWGVHPEFGPSAEAHVPVLEQGSDGTRSGVAFPVDALGGADHDFAARWQPPRGQSWLAILPADDLDGDGLTDLFAARTVGQRVRVGAISGASGAPLATDALQLATGVSLVSIFAIGDFDRDGRLDHAGTVLVRDRTHPVILTGAGRVEVLDALGAGSATLEVVPAGDSDGDGYEDVLFVTRHARGADDCARWVPGGPHGVDVARAHDRCGHDASDWRFLGPGDAGDFDGDGIADLALTQSRPLVGSRRVVVFRGGSAVLTGAPARIIDETDASLGLTAPPSGAFATGLAAGDGDGNGVDELFVTDPDAAGGDGRVLVLRETGPVRIVPSVSTSALIDSGVPDADTHEWIAAVETPPPNFGQQLSFITGAVPDVRAHITFPARGTLAFRHGRPTAPAASAVDAQLDAIIARAPGAVEALESTRPRLALGVAILAADAAHDANSVRALDRRLGRHRNAEYLYLEIEGSTPVRRALDAIRVGILAENDDHAVTPPLSMCRAILATGEQGITQFDDRWGSGQSGPSEEARDRCYSPLVRAAIADRTHAEDVVTAGISLRAAPIAVMAAASLPESHGSMENGFLVTAIDTVDHALFGAFAATMPSRARIEMANRRLAAAVRSRRARFVGLQPRVDAFLAGLDARIPLAAEGACALRGLRGESADAARCEAWTRIYVVEALARFVTDAWTTVDPEEPPARMDRADFEVW